MEQDNPEIKILLAAQKIFAQKGYDGARMQEIANEAGINKSLLHYYFRSKEKLYDEVFSKLVSSFFPDFMQILNSDSSLDLIIEQFFEKHIELLIQNPLMPLFIMTEIKNNPKRIYDQFFKNGNPVHVLINKIKQEIELGNIEPINPLQFLMNILSLSIFPFVMQPLIQLAVDVDEKQYRNLMEMRKKEVAIFVKNAIKLK